MKSMKTTLTSIKTVLKSSINVPKTSPIPNSTKHGTPPPHQLEQQYTDIYTQLKQLQPTSTTHPIVLNAANLEGKTAEKAIAKGQRYINQDLRRNLSQTKSQNHRRYIGLRKRTPTPERTSKNR